MNERDAIIALAQVVEMLTHKLLHTNPGVDISVELATVHTIYAELGEHEHLERPIEPPRS